MTAVPGLGNLATDLVGRKSFAGHCRTWGCNCLRTSKRTNRISIQAFRSERPANSHTEVSNGSSRLLNNRRAANRPQQAERPPRLDHQDEPIANSSRPSLIKRAPGRLLQRGNSSRQLPDTDKQTQQLPERQQVSDKQKDSDRKHASRASVLHHPQQSASSHQHNAKSSGKRFSQAAGKLSQKDWQVTTDWLAMDMQDGLLDEKIWKELLTDCDLQPCERPQATLYHQLGMTKADFSKIVDTRRSNGLLQLRVPTIQTKFRFFKDELSLSDEDIRKLLVKCPRVMEHKVESTMRPHLEFLQQQGVAKEDLGKIIQRAPHIFQLSLEGTLQPRLDCLKDQLGVTQEGLAKIIVKQPSVLTYSNKLMQERIDFLKESGFASDAVAKAAVAHPQVLHYLPESMQEKVAYLRDIGMGQEQVTQTILRLPQLLSLDVHRNLQPKYSYLKHQLGGTVKTLCKYPAYFSLSLPGRIIPRHRYLQMVRARPVNPFPMSYLKMSDQLFATKVADTPVAHFASFRDQMKAGNVQ